MGRTRYIDFNQGVDARLMTDAKMKKLAEVNIRPLRIAFDHWGVDPQKPNSKPMREVYEDAVKLAAKIWHTQLVKLLAIYNTDDDTPDELYLRLQYEHQSLRRFEGKHILVPDEISPNR